MKASKELYSFIKGKEHYEPSEYEDSTGTKTIGYGDTEGDTSKPISEEEASRRMVARVGIAEKELASVITRQNLTQGQQDALLDMHYNMGQGELVDTGLIDLVNKGKDDEVAAAILTYNKAKNRKTGKLEELAGLTKRAQARAQMYSDKVSQAIVPAEAPVQNPTTFNIRNSESLDTAIKDFETMEGQSQRTNPNRDLDKSIQEFESQGETPVLRVKSAEQLKIASDAADTDDVLKIQEAKTIAKETGAPFEIVMGMMTEGYKPKEIRAKAKIGDLARNFPAATRWAKDPENFAVLQETGDWAKEVEVTSNNLKDSNLSRAVDQGLLTMSEVATSLGAMLGTVSAEEAEERYTALDAEKQKHAMDNKDLADMRKVWGKYVKEGGSLWDVIAYTAERPAALGLQSVESAITSSLPFAMSMTGALIPPTLPYAVGGAFLSGGAIAAGSKFREALDSYVDPKTGERGTMGQALRDKDFMSRARKEASIYGSVMGTFDAAFGLVAGKFFPKLAAKGAAGKLAGGALEIASGPVSEGASETLATSAADVYTGKLTSKKWEENKRSGVIEGVMSIPVEGSFGPIAYGVNKAAPTARIKAQKTIAMATDGVQAIKDVANVSQLREKVLRVKDLHPDQAKAMVNEAMTYQRGAEIGLDDADTAFDNADKRAASDVRSMTREADEGMVHIAPSEWIEHFESRKLDPYTMMQSFGPEIHDVFLRNIESDTSVPIPMSDWVMLATEDQNIDLIARVGSNKYNGEEASTLMEAMDENPGLLFREDELPPLPDEADLPPPVPGQDTPPPLPGQEKPMTIIEATQAEGNAVLRPVDLVGKFNNEEEKRVFGGLKKKLQKLGKTLNIEKDAVDAFSDIQYGRLKHRSDVTGRNIEDIYKNLSVSTYSAEGASHKGFFDPGRLTEGKTQVSFNKGRENHIDTIIHEFGHAWLHEMAEDYHFISNIPEADLTPGQHEYLFAMEKMAELAGIKNVQEILTMDPVSYRKIHESFAQTTELYFLEGKYENNKVRAVMESFRTWIVDTIRYIKSMVTSYPTLALSPDVERMFEGILGTSMKIEETVIPMFTPALFTDEFLGADAAKYKEAMADAQSEAVGETYAKSFLRTLKENETLIKKETKRITERATEDVDNLPSMQFMNKMKDLHQQFKAGKIDQDPRLSYESIQEELLNGSEAETAWLKAHLPPYMMTGKKKGGVDVREFMYQNQIWSPDAALELLIQSTKRDKLIEARVQELITQDFPVTKSDEEIHDIAVDAVNGKGKEKLLMMELKILATKHLATLKSAAGRLMQPPTGMNNIAKEALHLEATDVVLNANAMKFSPDKYLRDSQRMAREASKAFRANDLVDAFNRKRNEAVTFMAFREAQAAQKTLAKGRHLTKLILKYAPSRDAMKKLDTDVLKYGFQLLTAMKAQAQLPKFADVTLSPHSGVTETHAKKIEDARIELISVMGNRTGADISVEAAIALTDLLQSILFVSRTAKEVEIEGRKASIAAVAGEILATVEADGPVTSYKKEGWFSAARRRVSNQKVSTGLASLYDSQEEYAASTFGVLMGGIREGEAKVGLDLADAETRLYDAFKKIEKSGVKKSKKETILAPLKRFSKPEPVLAPEMKFTFNNEGEMLMALATALGSESGMMRFLTSINPLTGEPIASVNEFTGEMDTSGLDKFVQRMIDQGKLRREHFELFNEIWSIFEGHHAEVADIMRQTDGIEMGKIKGKKFSNQFGEWTGGYVPVAEGRSIDESMIKAGLLTVDSDGTSMTDLYPTISTGLTKKRNKVSSNPLDLDMRKVLNYVSTASKIKHLRKPMMDFGKLMKRKDVSARLETRRPDFIKNVVTPWFDYTVDQIYTDPDKHIAHAIFGKLRKNANTVMYLGSLMTPVRQFYGLLPSVQRVGGGELRASLLRMGGIDQAKFIMGQAKEKSVFMRERAQGSLKKYVKTHDVLETNFDWWSQLGDGRDKLTYVLTQATQNIVDAATWDAGYNKSIAQGLSEKAAIRYADSAVADTQSSPNVSDMAMIQRGTNIERLLSMVTSVPIAMNNMIAEEMMRTPEGREKIKVMAAMSSLLLALPFLLESGVDALGDDDDEKDVPAHMLAMASKTAAGFLDAGFPVISRPLTGYLTYKNPSISPALSKLTNAARAPQILGNAVDGVDVSAKEMALLLETFTLFTSIPVSVGGRVIKFVDSKKSPQDQKIQLRKRRRQMRVARRSR